MDENDSLGHFLGPCENTVPLIADEGEQISIESVLVGLRKAMIGAFLDFQSSMLDDLDGG